MNVWSYLACVGAAVVATSIELAFRNQRHPFGDKMFKAVGWWLAVAIIDAAVGLLMLAGAVGIQILDPSTVSNTNKILQGIAVGALGPLALRSPVRRTQIQDQEYQVGITYVYDVARLQATYALDERFVRLKRRDVTVKKDAWQGRGLDSSLVAAAIHRHVDDHQRLAVDQQDRVSAVTANSLTLPSEDQRMTALIKLIREARFASLIDELNMYELGSMRVKDVIVSSSSNAVSVENVEVVVVSDEDLEVVEDEVEEDKIATPS